MKQIGSIAKRRVNIILKGFDPVSSGGFTQVPNCILKAKNISPGAKLCYSMLLKYAWHNNKVYPGQKRLSEEMGAGERSVVRYMKELQREKYLDVKRRGQGKTNIYTLHFKV